MSKNYTYEGWQRMFEPPARIAVIAADVRCTCDGASRCPLGRTGTELRCTEAELALAGLPVMEWHFGSVRSPLWSE